MANLKELKIQPIKCFKCPVCDTIHKIAPQASRCLKKCIEKAEEEALEQKKQLAQKVIRDSVRLDATSLTQAINLLVERSKEYYDIDIHLDSYPARFGLQRITHACPVGKVTNWHGNPKIPSGYLGWGGTWKGTIKGKFPSTFGDIREARFSEFIGTWARVPGFTGFHTGTGGAGSNGFSYDGTIFLEDFPKIYEDQIKKFEGNKICCDVNRWRKCTFCHHRWCKECSKAILEMDSFDKGCPFDGHSFA